MDSPVFVVVLSENCIYSNDYMVYHEKLTEYLQTECQINVVKIIVPDVNNMLLLDQHHPKLLTITMWTPSFFLFTYDAWNNHDSLLTGDVFNGYIDNGYTCVSENCHTLSFDTLVEWVKSSIENEKYYIQTKPAR